MGRAGLAHPVLVGLLATRTGGTDHTDADAVFASLLKQRRRDATVAAEPLPDEVRMVGGGEGRPARATTSAPHHASLPHLQGLSHAPVRLCFAYDTEEWCGDVRSGLLADLRQQLRAQLPSLAALSPDLLTAVREGAFGPLYPLALLATAPALFAPPPGVRVADVAPWVVVVAPRPDQPFANHSNRSDVVHFASLFKGRGSGAEFDASAAQLLRQLQRHGWARLRVPSEKAAAVRALDRTARTFFSLADSVKEKAQKKCPYTGKFWGWAREQKFLSDGEPAILPREYFMVRKEEEDFSDQLPWSLTPRGCGTSPMDDFFLLCARYADQALTS